MKKKISKDDIEQCNNLNKYLEGIIEDMYKYYLERAKTMKKPDYNVDDLVTFDAAGDKKTGKVYIVDAYGTFEQNEEPSYDVMVEEENCLYKHIRESLIIDGVHKETVDSMDEAVNNIDKSVPVDLKDFEEGEE